MEALFAGGCICVTSRALSERLFLGCQRRCNSSTSHSLAQPQQQFIAFQLGASLLCTGVAGGEDRPAGFCQAAGTCCVSVCGEEQQGTLCVGPVVRQRGLGEPPGRAVFPLLRHGTKLESCVAPDGYTVCKKSESAAQWPKKVPVAKSNGVTQCVSLPRLSPGALKGTSCSSACETFTSESPHSCSCVYIKQQQTKQMAELADDSSVQLFARPNKRSSKRKLSNVDSALNAPKAKHSKPDNSSPPQQQQQQQDLERGSSNPASTSGGSGGHPKEEDVTFQDLGVSDWLCSVLSSLGIKRPTQVQAGCIPAILQGRNVIGTAQTGSGKTAAFALPILQQLAKDPYGVFCLVLTPTRCD